LFSHHLIFCDAFCCLPVFLPFLFRGRYGNGFELIESLAKKARDKVEVKRILPWKKVEIESLFDTFT
jgi:hypothetical protein